MQQVDPKSAERDRPLRALPVETLSGSARVPGDKSISHRALMLGALAVGETRIEGLLEGEDVLATAAAMRALGALVVREGPGRWRVDGRGLGGLREPEDVLDLGNSGTAARLILGILAGHPISTCLTGDASLRRRPMGRVTKPLGDMGAVFLGREGDRLPLVVRGAREVVPIVYRLPVASAQVKSAILLAGLNAPGRTTVIEPRPTRDHTELMFRHFGVEVSVAEEPDGARAISVTGQPELEGRHVAVPADPSSAAFPLVAAAALPGADIRLEGVGLNPTRTGLLEVLERMGADIEVLDRRIEAGEPVGDLRIRGRRLSGVEVPPEIAPRMIDEYPVLAVAAAAAEGETRMLGLAELKVKESDRLAATAAGLSASGVGARVEGDSLIVQGAGGRPAGCTPVGRNGGGRVATHFDHRIAMAFLMLGLISERPIEVDDARAIETSFPGFAALIGSLGGRIEPAGEPASAALADA